MAEAPPLPTTTEVEDTNRTEWAPWVRQFVAVGLVIAAVYALTLLSPILYILVTTFLISFLIFVPARSLARNTRLHYRPSVLLIFALLLIALLVALVALVPGVVQLLQNVQTGISSIVGQVRESLTAWDPAKGGYTISILGVNFDITEFATPIRNLLLTPDQGATTVQAGQSALSNVPFNAGSVIGTVTGIITGTIGTISQFFSTLFLGLFLSLLILLELPTYEHRILTSVPNPYQRELRLLADKIMHVWRGFFKGQIVLCVLIGAITFLQLAIMGVRSALPLALIVAVISLLPTIGGFIALIPLGIIPYLQGSTVFTGMSNGSFALLVIAINLAISQVIWNVIAPKIMGDAVSLPLPVIIIGIVIGTALGGILGAFLVVPVLGTIRVCVAYLLAKVMRREPYPGEETPNIMELREI
jgi:predicted PurR-regulated permease PerM